MSATLAVCGAAVGCLPAAPFNPMGESMAIGVEDMANSNQEIKDSCPLGRVVVISISMRMKRSRLRECFLVLMHRNRAVQPKMYRKSRRHLCVPGRSSYPGLDFV